MIYRGATTIKRTSSFKLATLYISLKLYLTCLKYILIHVMPRTKQCTMMRVIWRLLFHFFKITNSKIDTNRFKLHKYNLYTYAIEVHPLIYRNAINVWFKKLYYLKVELDLFIQQGISSETWFVITHLIVE